MGNSVNKYSIPFAELWAHLWYTSFQDVHWALTSANKMGQYTSQ